MFSLIALYFSYRRQAAAEAIVPVQALATVDAEPCIELPLAA